MAIVSVKKMVTWNKVVVMVGEASIAGGGRGEEEMEAWYSV